MAWVAPAALIGLGLVALPIAIHLLVRQQARSLAYPSLRFLRETQLARLRRRTIQDAALLLCRVAIIALAAVALAGPILQMPARTAGHAGRTSIAVVALEGADDLISAITGGAFASATFRRPAIADSFADAMRWLDQQPASSREIVIAGALRRGAIAEGDLAIIPKEIGVHFSAISGPSSNDLTWPVLTRRNGSLVRVDRAVHLETDETRVVEGQATPVPNDLISIVARGEDTPLAQAALRAALVAGVAWSDFDRRIVIVWEGADEGAITRNRPAARTIRMAVPSPPAAAADQVLRALTEFSPPDAQLEPVMITPEQLASWSRTPGPPATHAPLADEGDRRWAWASVLALLAVETWMRRRRSESTASIAEDTEARVA
jgi:hypothetical protein